MGDTEQMPKLNLAKDKISKTLLDYMKIVEDQNFARVEKLRRVRRNNLLTALGLGVGVFSIYAYSILAVRQESFLDDFEPPPVKRT